MTNESIAAIVPMRHQSFRVPRKNFRPFAGIPLYRHIVETLLSVKGLDQVVIDTDSPTIKQDVSEFFPDVLVLERPEHLRDDKIPMNEVLANTMKQLESSTFLQTHSTNPLLKPETIDRAIDAHRHAADHDSLFGVTRLQTRLWDENTKPLNHDPKILIRTQDLPPLFEENSNIYIFTEDSFALEGNRIGQSPLMFEIDPIEAWDIDEESDFLIAEAIYTASRSETKV